MKAYIYDNESKEYIGEEECQIDPLETQIAGYNIYANPANATLIKPKIKEGYKTIWDETKWKLVEIKQEDKQEFIITKELTKEETIQRKINNLQYYLNSTDLYVTRFVETGKKIPDDIRIKRQKAREEISELRAKYNL